MWKPPNLTECCSGLLILFCGAYILNILFSAAPISAGYTASEMLKLYEATAVINSSNLVNITQIKDGSEHTVKGILEISDDSLLLLSTDGSEPDIFLHNFITSDNPPSTLLLEIKLQNDEYLEGFDQPFLIVSVDSEIIYLLSFSDALAAGYQNYQKLFIPLPILNPGDHQLEIRITNTGDSLFGTQVAISDIRTDAILIGGSDTLLVTASAHTRLKISDTIEYDLSKGEQLDIPLTEVSSLDKIVFEFPELSLMQSIPIETDLISPEPPHIISSKNEPDGSLTFHLTSLDEIISIETQCAENIICQEEGITSAPILYKNSVIDAARVISEGDEKSIITTLGTGQDSIRFNDKAGNVSEWLPILVDE